jgi:DNA-directed RNA polymerase subunit RPC12/RpoP
MIPILGVFVFLLFAVVFVSVIAGMWRMRGLTNKVFSLAEQELERKLREGPSRPTVSTETPPDPSVCSHCGSRVVANVAQCPNCGAGLLV